MNTKDKKINNICKMPKMPIRKTMKATVLTKRTQHLRKYYRERSYKPLHTKLKNNNNYLAKALSEEKQANQSLFQQNLALIAEVQTLNLECNKRNNVIGNILNNAKEMLKMVVTMSRYATNTITMCQDFNTSNLPVRLSSDSTGRKESMRLSTKSPAKGVVKPMVSGHTITKPTINLSRVNTTNFNNQISRLSDIQEVVTPVRSLQINEDRSSTDVSLPSAPLTYEPGRTFRMPERVAISSPRVNDLGTFTMFDEPRLRRRISESYSRSQSNRWSIDETPKNNTEHINIGFPKVKLKDISKLLKKSQTVNVDKTPRNNTEHINIGFPTIKLKDVSKLLKNSQSINIKRLFDDKVDDIEIQESSDDIPHNTSNKNIQDRQVSVNSDEEDETYAHISKKDPIVQISSKVSDKNFDRSSNVTENSKPSQNNNRDWEEDPLEGPSWLFNNTFTIPSRDEPEEELDHHDSDVNNNTSQITIYDDSSDSSIEDLPMSNLSERVSNKHTSQRDAASIADRIGYRSYLINDDETDDSFCGLAANVSSRKINLENTQDDVNFSSFVTMRRGHSKAMEEETEDFTLMLSHKPKRNMPFDINELRLPVVEKSMINSTINNGIDTKATAVLMNISIPSMSSQSLNKSEFNRTATKLPFILIDDHERILTPEKKKNLNKKNKKTKSPSLKDEISDTENAVRSKNKVKQKNKSENQDPNAVKVVVEKLHESHIKTRMSLADETRSLNSTNHTNVSIIFDEEKDQRYSEDSIDSSCVALRRPKRRKAPTNLKEPNLHRKMRRNK